MVLIKTIEELQKYMKVDSTFPVKTLDSYQDSAIEKYLRDVLGDKLTIDLVAWYEAQGVEGAPVSATMTSLLPFAAKVVAKFAFMLAGPNLDLKLMDAGFTVHSTEGLAPASKDRVNRLIESLEADGWDAVEQLLRFLEGKKADYADWTASDAYTLQIRNFINSAEDFDKYVPINKSRLKFKNLRIPMDNVEILEVVPVIGEALAADIKAKVKAGTALTAPYALVLEKIKRAVANLTAAGEMDPKYKKLGDHFLSEVRKCLDAAPDSYPLYRDSGLYVLGKTYEKFENTEDYSFFVAGGG